MSSIGKIGVRSSGPAGCIVPGLSGGSGSPGRSGRRFTQWVGMRSSVSVNFVWGVTEPILNTIRLLMEGASRTRLVALAVLLAVSIPLVVIAAAGGGSDESAGTGLRIEPSAQGAPFLVIYLEDADVNEPATNHGKRLVAIECVDDSDNVVFSGEKRW